VAAFKLEGVVAPLVFDGPVNARVVDAYVEPFLTPALKAGDSVVMDNLSSHKAPRIGELIEAAGGPCSICRPAAATSIPSKRCSPNDRGAQILFGRLRLATQIAGARQFQQRRLSQTAREARSTTYCRGELPCVFAPHRAA
jgi:hypothetical protein